MAGGKPNKRMRRASRWARRHEFRYPQAGRQLYKRLGGAWVLPTMEEDSARTLYNRLKKRKWGKARRLKSGQKGKGPH